MRDKFSIWRPGGDHIQDYHNLDEKSVKFGFFRKKNALNTSRKELKKSEFPPLKIYIFNYKTDVLFMPLFYYMNSKS